MRGDAHALRDLGDQLELGRLLDDEDDRPAQLGGHQRGLDVLLVLVAVADDERLFVVEHRHDGEQLRLGAGLQAVVVRAAELDDLLDDVAVLVDLDRVDALVLAAVAVLGDRAVNAFSSMRERRMSVNRISSGSPMPRATTSSTSSFMSIWPGCASTRGATHRFPASFTWK